MHMNVHCWILEIMAIYCTAPKQQGRRPQLPHEETQLSSRTFLEVWIKTELLSMARTHVTYIQYILPLMSHIAHGLVSKKGVVGLSYVAGQVSVMRQGKEGGEGRGREEGEWGRGGGQVHA
jgi:hypothetical protein